MPEDYRQELGYFEEVGIVFGLSLLPSDEVGTAFADEIMSTIPADDRCRKFADYIVDHYIDSGCDFAPDLRASSPQQSPTTTNATESLHADHTCSELHQLAGLHSARWISLCALVFLTVFATCLYSVHD